MKSVKRKTCPTCRYTLQNSTWYEFITPTRKMDIQQEITMQDKLFILIETLEELNISHKPLTHYDLKNIITQNESVNDQVEAIKIKTSHIHYIRKYDGRINLYDAPLLNITVFKHPEYYKYNKDIMCYDFLKCIMNFGLYICGILMAGMFVILFTGFSMINGYTDAFIVGLIIYICWRWCIACWASSTSKLCVYPLQIVFDDECLNPHRY
jgi:hypothetical protein